MKSQSRGHRPLNESAYLKLSATTEAGESLSRPKFDGAPVHEDCGDDSSDCSSSSGGSGGGDGSGGGGGCRAKSTISKNMVSVCSSIH